MSSEAPMHGHDERSITQLFADATKDVTEIMRQEIRLIRLEMGERMSAFTSGLAPLVVAAAFALAGLVVLLLAASLALARLVQPLALATAIIGGGALLLALVAAAVGLKMLGSRELAPHRAKRSLRRDKELVQRHV